MRIERQVAASPPRLTGCQWRNAYSAAPVNVTLPMKNTWINNAAAKPAVAD
jgi:hypothetical protein